jgi:tetratricopeptide (TPR) repeat protein
MDKMLTRRARRSGYLGKWLLVIATMVACALSAQEQPGAQAAASDACGKVAVNAGKEYLLKAADCLRNKGLYREALQCYEKVPAPEVSQSFGLLMGMGLCFEGLKENEKARPFFEKACLLDGKNRDAVYHLGIACEGLGDSECAMQAFKRVLELDPEDEDAYRNIGLVYLENEEYDLAIEALKRAIAINPKDAKAHHNLSITYEDKMQSLRNESSAIMRGMVPGKAYPVDDPQQVRLEEITADLQHNDYYGMAISEAKEETNLSPDDPQAWYSLGTTYLHDTRKYGKQARAALEEALRLRPDYYEALVNVMAVLSKSRDRDPRALKDYALRLLAKWPSDTTGLNHLCDAEYELGDYQAALAAAEKSIAADDTQASPFFMKALALRKLGETEAALKAYEKAKSLALDPNEAWCQKHTWEHEEDNPQ